MRLGLVRDHVIDIFVDFIHHLKHEDHHEVGDRRAGEHMSLVVPNLDIEIVKIIFGENIPHGNLRVIGEVREPKNIVVDELKHVGRVHHHRSIIHRAGDHRVVAERLGSDVYPVMVFVGSRVRGHECAILRSHRGITPPQESRLVYPECRLDIRSGRSKE